MGSDSPWSSLATDFHVLQKKRGEASDEDDASVEEWFYVVQRNFLKDMRERYFGILSGAKPPVTQKTHRSGGTAGEERGFGIRDTEHEKCSDIQCDDIMPLLNNRFPRWSCPRINLALAGVGIS